jgi:hypothetical protein
MPWQETDEQNKRLFDALSELAHEKGALERLAGAINADHRALASDRARQGNKHKPRKTLVAESTLGRWQEEGLGRVTNAQSHKKRIVFEFLERSADFRTELFRPLSGLPAGLAEFAGLHRDQIGEAFSSDLAELDGTYRVFRPARHDLGLRHARIRISRLQIVSSGGVTRFIEFQRFKDPDLPNFPMDRTDDGLVLSMTGNILLLGKSRDGFYSGIHMASFTHPRLGTGAPVRRLVGVTLDNDGRDRHIGEKFVASRSSEPWEEIEMGVFRPPHDRLAHDILDALDFGDLEARAAAAYNSRWT